LGICLIHLGRLVNGAWRISWARVEVPLATAWFSDPKALKLLRFSTTPLAFDRRPIGTRGSALRSCAARAKTSRCGEGLGRSAPSPDRSEHIAMVTDRRVGIVEVACLPWLSWIDTSR
jgi:hypothetical protein